MRRLKLVLVGIAGFLIMVVILQNTTQVTIRMLYAEVTLPRALLLFLTLVFGFVLGFAVCMLQRRREHKKVDGEENASSANESQGPDAASPGQPVDL